MIDATIWHDPQRDRWYIQRKHYIEEIFPLTLEYMQDQQEENERLRKLCSDMFKDFANCDCELKRHGRTFMVVSRYASRLRVLGVGVN